MLGEDLNIIAAQWLEEKKQRMINLRKIALPDEALYREIMLSLGYPKTKCSFWNWRFFYHTKKFKN